MERELKIVVSIFLIFLVFGLVSLGTSGSFATPVFLQHFVYVPVALLFYLLNIKEKGALNLLLFVPITMFGLLIDDFSITLLSEKYQSNLLYELTTSVEFSWFFLFAYFGFFLYMSYLFYTESKKIWIMSISTLLLLFVILGLFHTNLSGLSGIVFLLFLAFQILTLNRYSTSENKVKKVLSFQFLLIIMLQSLQYFL
jgi:hypothetical protein